jgi:hypothetical protein
VVAQQIAGEGLAAVRDALATLLGRDPGWKALSSRATADALLQHGLPRRRRGGAKQ